MFRHNYLSFRALLTANNNALELMAELEKTLIEGQPFGMAFVRGHSTALSVNVYKMIQNLQTISAGRYAGLEEAFSRITAKIEAILEKQPSAHEGPYILDLSEIGRSDTDLVGDKMANLGEAANRAGVKIPAGFVITAAATQRFMGDANLQEEINRQIQSLDIDDLEGLYSISASVQKLISSAALPDDVAGAVMEAYGRLAERTQPHVLISMRSSAVGEDSRSVSFAGQYRTQLNVSEEFILQTYKEIVASKYRSQAIVYRHQRGFRHQDVIMSVGCLEMVDAAVSGVMFSRSPRHPGSDWIEISAAPGPGSQVVEGRAAADVYRVERRAPAEILLQQTAAGDPVLSLEQLRELARTAVSLEDHFGPPQDIEWCIDRGGTLKVLQSRPVSVFEEPGGTGREDETGQGNGNGGRNGGCAEALLSGGVTVSRGSASGPVFVVHSNVDLLEFPRGAILVVENPLPEWASLIGRAAGVICDRGHAATHLAIVAREFGKPAVFGIRDATGILANGEVITLDASTRCIYHGRKEEMLSNRAAPPNLMQDSPIFRILEEISALAVPLNLTDPESPFFTPLNCRTLHDLTRYCHEKAVTDMFEFGRRTGLRSKAAKQLAGETPLEWWIINLDDGFSEDFDEREKYVFIQHIVSRPMLSIWEGMTARPWQGPPPVSLKGFGSILYRSTMNPSIDPAVRASMSGKNYFLISRNFCNLSMRLGYHFTLVEAYVGSHLTENYVSFQFRGGAADRSRRFIRVQLLRDILEQYGFRVEVLLDALTARIEKQPADYLLERLKVLGYLLIHTRQIDMVMGEKVMVGHYRTKIMNDLAEIVVEGGNTDESSD